MPDVVLDAAQALGLLRADGAIDADWFRDPLSRIRSVLRDPSQREAVLRSLEALAPARAVVDDCAWHPLGGPFALTVARGDDSVTLGLGVEVGGDVRFRAHLRVADVDGGEVSLPPAPVSLDLRVPLDWSRPARPLTLSAVRASARFGATGEDVTLVLEGFDLDGAGPRDVEIDSAAAEGGEAALLLGLLVAELRAAGGAVSHLPSLLGFADGIPPFPIADVESDAGALRRWLDALVTGESPPAPLWLGHLAALAGSASTAAGAGTPSDPWRVRIASIADGGLDLTLAREETAPGIRRLVVGLTAVLTGSAAPAGVELSFALAAVPLAGNAAVEPLTYGRLSVRAELGSGSPVRALAGGLGFTRADGRLRPFLELEDVDVGGAHYDRLDLSNAASVTAAAAGALAATLTGLLGPRLAALAGLARPASDPAWPHLVDPVALASHPLEAIGAVHRAALGDPQHGWSHLFAELATLLVPGGTPDGTGTLADPWRVALGTSGDFALDLCAWSEGDSALHVGLGVSAAPSIWQVRARVALLAVELPASGAPRLSLLGRLHLAATLAPPAPGPLARRSGMIVSADAAGLALDWTPGAPLRGRAFARNLAIEADGVAATIPSLELGADSAFDAAALGLTDGELNRVLVALAERAARYWGGPAGRALATLVGVRPTGASGPTLAEAATGSVLDDPAGTLRAWLASVATQSPRFMPAILGALQEEGPAVGAGVRDAPWVVALAPQIELLAWLTPGPPAEWLEEAKTRVAASSDFVTLLGACDALAAFVPALRSALAETSRSALAGALIAVGRHLSDGDGVVPLAAQAPDASTTGPPIAASHRMLPLATAALDAVAEQVDAWAAGGDRLVLLLSAPVADRSSWSALLERVGDSPGGVPHFDLRRSEAALADVAAPASFYTADLDPAQAGAQIDRLLDRLGELVPGVPVTLVAHSATAITALEAAAARPARVRGVITLAAPYGGAALRPLRDPAVALGVRFLQQLGPGALGATPLADAVGLLGEALDGWRDGAPGELPARSPFPLSAFQRPATAPSAAVPTLAITATLDEDLLPTLRQGLLALAEAAAIPATPTHLELGVRASLLAAPDVDLRVRADVARVALTAEVDPPPATLPAWRVDARAVLRGADGWLVGSPGDTLEVSDARARWAEVGVEITPEQTVPIARLHQAAWRGPLAPVIDFPGPAARALLGAVLTVAPGEAAGGRRRLLDALAALGLATRDPDGRLALSLDALDALTAGARTFLGARLDAALLDDRLWTALGTLRGSSLAVGPVDLALEGPDRRLVGRTVAAGLPIAGSATLHATARLGGPRPELDAELVVSGLHLRWSGAERHLSVAVDDWLEPLTLVPATSAELAHAAAAVAPRLALSVIGVTLLERLVPEGLVLGALDRLVTAPGHALASPKALGDGQALDGSRVAALLDLVAGLAHLPPGPGLPLPGGLSLTASGAPGVVELALATTAPIGPAAVAIDARARIDSTRHVTPAGRVSATIPLPGAWPAVGIAIVASETGFVLELTPEGGETIRLWPFGGLGALADMAAALLPAALDAIVDALPPGSPLLAPTLDLARALGCYDDALGFAGHADELRALAEHGLEALPSGGRAAIAAAVAQLLGPGGVDVPGSVAADSARLTWSFALPPAAGTGSLELAVDLAGADVTFSARDVAPGGGALRAGLDIHAGSGALDLKADVGLALDGLPTPLLRVRGDSTGLSVDLLPLGADAEDALTVTLAPDVGVHVGASGLRDVVLDWALPLVARRLMDEARPHLAAPAWPGGPALGDLLTGAGILTDAMGLLASPLPRPAALARCLVGALGAASVPLSPTLRARMVTGPDGVGLRLVGRHDLDVGGLRATLMLGEPSTFVDDADRGLTIILFAGTTVPPTFRPSLRLVGCGVGLQGAEGGPLVDADPVHVGGVRGYLFGELGLGGAFALTGLGAGLELDGVGLPLGHAASGGSNPVVSSLLGAASGVAGDARPVSPTLDVAIYDRGAGLQVRIAGQGGPVWVPVQGSFGPIYVEQIGAVATAEPGIDVLVDGSVRLGGLQIALDDLTLSIPFRALATPGDWAVDLRGLGIAFSGAGATVSGALSRSATQPQAYDGFLLAEVGGRSFAAVGSYAAPSDGAGRYPSMFAFAAVSVPLGGPPMLYVTGLGGGAGYNRALSLPARVTDVENFILVEAIDDASLADDPGNALARLSQSVPPRRGAMFLAAGARFTSYGFVRSVALASVELDRGVDVDVLAISRMRLPVKGTPLANVELALHARYSSTDRVLSVIGQLTDQSWILDKDCQLTGGFAFAWWFDDGQVVLTLGGYHPHFVRPARFPDVPRLGFNWRVSDRVVIKGEAYFALTSSCVMAGGRLEATYQKGSIRAWFATWADILVGWDPFRYDFEIGVTVGASWTTKVCFIKCVHLSFSVSIGADLRLAGPALHGSVTVHLAVASVTFDFGDETSKPTYLPAWTDFAAKYLAGPAPVGVRVERGVLRAAGSGEAPDGSVERPWRVTGELALVTETRMPADRYAVSGGAPLSAAGAAALDLAPLGPDATGIASRHDLVVERSVGQGWTAVPLGGPRLEIAPVIGRVPEATYRFRADGDEVPAANTLPALLGLRLDARGEPEGQRPPVRLADLVESGARSRPLPFAAPAPGRREQLDALGLSAEALVELTVRASTETVTRAAGRILSGDPTAQAARVQAGLPPAGLRPASVAALSRRSAPPLVTPLATGLARRDPGLDAPPPRPEPPADAPPPLLAPRLRAVLAGPPAAPHEAPRPATRVSAELARDAARVPAPAAAAAVRLTRLPPPDVVPATRAALTGRSFRTGELGSPLAPRARDLARKLEAGVADTGVTIPAGTTQLWDLPASGPVVELRGDVGARLTFLGAGGAVLSDGELMPGAGVRVPPPVGATAVAVACLGVPPQAIREAGPGAITGRAAPPGGIVAVGWELSDRAPLVAPTTALVRGACLMTSGRRPGAGGRPLPELTELSRFVAGPADAETWLPGATPLVLVLLDELDPTAALNGDLALSATGGTLVGPVVRAQTGRRRALLYEVREPAATGPLVVGVSSARGFGLAGVVGLAGRASDWAERLGRGIPDGLVPDGPLTPFGELMFRLIPEVPR